MENTIENNKMIAEFMGWEFGRYDNLPNRCHIGKFNTNSEKGMDKESAKYDSDWNWLMEVVEKIECLSSYIPSLCIQISNGYISIVVNAVPLWADIRQFSDLTKIQSVYLACVKFIQWYNLQKKIIY